METVVTLEDIERIAMQLPGAIAAPNRLAYSVLVNGKEKGFIWAWAERVDPKKGRVPNPAIWAVRVASLSAKEVILGSDPAKYFTEDHYNGYPAVLVRLAAIDVEELEDLILEAWRTKAPAALRKELDARV